MISWTIWSSHWEKCKKIYQPDGRANNSTNKSCSSGVVDCEKTDGHISLFKARFKKQKMESGLAANRKNELEVYLGEGIIESDEKLDVLKWWKVNSERLPTLSKNGA